MSESGNKEGKQRERWERRRDKRESPPTKDLKGASPLKVIAEPPVPNYRKNGKTSLQTAAFIERFVVDEWPMDRMVLSPTQWEILKTVQTIAMTPTPPTKDEEIAEWKEKFAKSHNQYTVLTNRYWELQSRLTAESKLHVDQDQAYVSRFTAMQEKIDKLQALLDNREDIKVMLDRDHTYEERYG